MYKKLLVFVLLMLVSGIEAWLGGKEEVRGSDALHPLQIDPGILEAFYDWTCEICSPVTASNRMSGLKCFCKAFERVVPGWSSPWRYAPKQWRKKIGKAPKMERKKALNLTETRRQGLCYQEAVQLC